MAKRNLYLKNTPVDDALEQFMEAVRKTVAVRYETISVLDALDPEGMPSMRQDAEAHRPTELALFAKTVRALGREYGMATPVNDFLYDRITAIEAAYSEEKGRKNG